MNHLYIHTYTFFFFNIKNCVNIIEEKPRKKQLAMSENKSLRQIKNNKIISKKMKIADSTTS